jgi:hypothetical protein
MNKYKEGEIHFNLMGVVEDKIARYNRWIATSSIADPESGTFLTSGSGMGKNLAPGSATTSRIIYPRT